MSRAGKKQAGAEGFFYAAEVGGVRAGATENAWFITCRYGKKALLWLAKSIGWN